MGIGGLIGSLRVTLGFDTAEFTAGTKKARAEAKSTANSIQGTFSGLKTAAAALAGGAIVASVIGATKRALDYASSLNEVSQQLGVASRDLQVYRYAATQVGISQEEMDKGLQKFTRTLGEAKAGNIQAIGAFRELGLSMDDIKKGDVHTALLKTADGLSQIRDPANRAAAEVKLFGRAGQQLDTLLSGGSKAINDLAKAAQDLGIVLSDKQIQNADRTADRLAELKLVLEARIAGVVADNADAIYKLANSIVTLTGAAADFTAKHPRGIASALGFAAGGAGGAIAGYGLSDPTASAQLRGSSAIYDSKGGGLHGALAVLTSTKGELIKAGQKKLTPEELLAQLNGNTLTAPGGVGKTFTDPSARASAAAAADKAAREAEKQRQEALRQEDRFQSEKARSDDEFLGLRQQLTTDARAQAALQHEQIDRDVEAKARDLDLAVQEKQITAARAAQLKALDARNADLQHGVVNRDLDGKLDQQELDAKIAGLSNQRDILAASSDLARTAKDRRDIEIKLLDLQFQEERARQEAIIASRESTAEQKKLAQQRLDTLPDLYGAQRAGIERRNAGPGKQYLDGLIQSADEARDALQGVEVDGLKSLEDGLTGVITGTQSMGSAFKSVANGIVADLARIAIQRAVIGPLANALFGGADGGEGAGLGGLFGSLLGHGSGAGGSVTGLPDVNAILKGGWSLDPRMGFATGGGFKVGGMGPADSKLFPLRLSPGEMVDVTRGGKSSAGDIHVHLNVQGGVDLATRSETYRLADAVRVAVKREMAEDRRRGG